MPTATRRTSGRYSRVTYEGRSVVDTVRLLKSKGVQGTLETLDSKIKGLPPRKAADVTVELPGTEAAGSDD